MRRNAWILSAGAVAATLVLGAAMPDIPARAGGGAVTGAGTGAGTGAVTGSSPGAPVPVIVFLKNQPRFAQAGPAGLGHQAAAVAAAQAPYLRQLRQAGATGIKAYHLVDAFAATVPQWEVVSLAASQGVSQVIPDSPVKGPDPVSAAAATPGTGGQAAPLTRMPAGACSATPQLEPEGLALTGTDSPDAGVRTARSLGYTGAGVRVGFLADGLDPENVNLLRDGQSVVTDYHDFTGDGTSSPTGGGEAFGDASAIAGQGRHVYDTRGFSAQSPRQPCDIRIEGTAPGADLDALKVFGAGNTGSTSGILQAIDYAATTDRVSVLSESFGSDPLPDATSLEAITAFNDAATAAGVTVVVAGDDPGPSGATGSPAGDPDVLSVGATTGFRFYAQTDYAAADQFAKNGWLDGNISALSPGGYTQQGSTVDMVAPGDLSFASCTANLTEYSDCENFLGTASDIESSGGTTESAAEVAGAAALVIQAYRKAHGGSAPTPSAVRQILTSAASDLGAAPTEQGAGQLNALKAVELAEWMPNRPPAGETLRVSGGQPGSGQPGSGQLNAVGAPGSSKSWQLTVTNTGAKRQTVALSGRAFTQPRSVASDSVTLSDATSPHFADWAGGSDNYRLIRFSVPSGQARLDASVAWPAGAAGQPATRQPSPDSGVRLILVTPSGQFAAGSMPQVTAGYGSAEVLHPAAGTWTAVIFSPQKAAHPAAGRVTFGASVSADTTFGAVSPSRLTLPPGASGKVRFSITIPNGGGDSSGAIVLDPGDGATGATTVPVTLRGIVPTGERPGRLSGVLTGGTGGTGRAPGEGQVDSYEFTVPRSIRSLAADVVLASTPATQVNAYLVAPGGQTMGYGSSDLTTGFTGDAVPVESPRRQVSTYTSDPVPGTWTLIVGFSSPVPESEPAEPFTGTVLLNSTRAARGGLPSSASTVLARGKAYSYPITITNTGAAPEDIFLDPRLDSLATYALQPQDNAADLPLPWSGATGAPEWIVPTMTHSVEAQASGTVPVTFRFGPHPGGPDTASGAGMPATVSYPPGSLPTPVTQGLWSATPSEAGPDSDGTAQAPSVTMSMSATTEAFDTTVSSRWGDFWKFAVAPLGQAASYDVFTVEPGQTATIDATIRPAGPAGRIVAGTLYVDDFADSTSFLAGSQLAALPYVYKVGA